MYCEECGKYSGRYKLCKDCYEELNESIIEDYEEDEDEDYSAGICIACQSPKEYCDYFFCTECYKQYKNKSLIIKIDKCRDITLLDSFYYSKYVCADGHIVKSKAERDIDNFLFKHRIAHCYERPLSIDDNPEHDLHPDFYLPDLQLYIEHWGMEDDEQYNSQKEYKIPLYEKLKVTLICTHENTDSIDMESALRRKLKHYKKGEINFL